MAKRVRIIGGGLAGCEAAYQLLKRGYEVELCEMRPKVNTPCHKSAKLAELVCSNSLKSMLDTTASGLLKKELELLDSLLIRCAYATAVPAGGALSVDRDKFSDEVTNALESFDNFRLNITEVEEIDTGIPTVIASGPLTSDKLAQAISKLIGEETYLHFYDAVAPIISADSIDMDIAFTANRFDKGGDADYLNCGMERDEYARFYDALVNAQTAQLKDFEKSEIFEGCMPIEVMAARGAETIRYGMLKPVGIINPTNSKRYYAVVQLRKENVEGTMYNLVGFQTNLTFPEQRRVFRLIPGLENAEFLRYGVMHRNTFINSPKLLDDTFRFKGSDNIYFAGQITGVEGYVESIMSGLIAAINLDARENGKEKFLPPETTICGALMSHISTQNPDFQPMNANFGILPEIKQRDKQLRKQMYSARGYKDMSEYIDSNHV